MDRRGFIRGMLVSAAGGTALVKLASAEETQAVLAPGPVAVGNIEPEFTPPVGSSPEVYMRHNGVFLCVGILRSFKTSQSIVDMTSWTGEVVLVPGLKRGEMTFEGWAR